MSVMAYSHFKMTKSLTCNLNGTLAIATSRPAGPVEDYLTLPSPLSLRLIPAPPDNIASGLFGASVIRNIWIPVS